MSTSPERNESNEEGEEQPTENKSNWCEIISYGTPIETEDKSVQVNLNRSPKGIWIIITGEPSLMVWTSIRSFTLLASLEECTEILLSEKATAQIESTLTLEEQIVLVFIKLKTNLSFLNIASLFVIEENEVPKIINRLLPILRSMFKSDRWRDKLEKKNSPLYELLYRDIKLK